MPHNINSLLIALLLLAGAALNNGHEVNRNKSDRLVLDDVGVVDVCQAAQVNNNDHQQHQQCAASRVSSTLLAATERASSAAAAVSSKRSYSWKPEVEHPCNIQRFTLNQLFAKFGARGVPSLYPMPLVIDLQQPMEVSNDIRTDHDGDSSKNDIVAEFVVVDYANHFFRNLTTPSHLLTNFPPNFTVTLSSSNSFSERRRTIPLSQYVSEILDAYETSPDVLSNETWYLFGETYTYEWQEMLLGRHYQVPPCHTCSYPSMVALAFGLGNRGSGVQWHVHGPGFSQAIHGRKHWILSDTQPPYHPNTTSRYWMEYEYPKYQAKQQQQQQQLQLYECTLLPGDILYFPNHWYHATINLDPYTAFVSSFTTEHKTMEL